MSNKAILEMVEEVFDELSVNPGSALQINPFTGGMYVPALDPIEDQKAHAVKVVEAAIAFGALRIPNAPAFPLDYEEREALKGKGFLEHIVGLYARSLSALKYSLSRHPSFAEYASGVLAHPYLGDYLQGLYPQQTVPFQPVHLPGIDASGYFNPPKGHSGLANA